MPIPAPADAFQYTHVLKTSVSDKTKKILAQIGSVVGNGQVDADNVEWIQHVGFASRPPEAVAGKTATSAVVLRLGNTEVAVASQDIRGLDIYGALAPGETCIYATGEDGTGQARVLLKKDGGISMYTRKGNVAGGAGMLMQLDAQAGAIRLVNDQGYGLIIDADGIKLTAGSSALTLNADGSCSLIGTQQTQVDGSTIVLGSIAAPVINSVCVGPAGLVAVASGKVFAALA